MEPIRINYQEALLYAALINAGIGLVLGLIPLVLGIVKGKLKYGILGLISSILGGAIFGIFLSIPAAVVFIWLVLKNPAVDAQTMDSENN